MKQASSFLFILIVISSVALANDIAAIENYLNSLHNITADFVQTDSHNKQQKGKFFLARPGKMRWQYEIPKKILIIINDQDLIHFDQQLDQVSYFKSKDDFLSLLAKKSIHLTGDDLLVSKVTRKDKKIFLTVKKKGKFGMITLVFAQPKLQLINLEIIDDANHLVVVEFHAFKEVSSIDNKLFALHNRKLSRSNHK